MDILERTEGVTMESIDRAGRVVQVGSKMRTLGFGRFCIDSLLA